MKKHLFVLLFWFVTCAVLAQSRFELGDRRYKYLPFETSIHYKSPNAFGFRVAVENQIIFRERLDIVLGKPVRSKKEVLTRGHLINTIFNKQGQSNLELDLGLSLSYRKTYGNGFQLEPILGYSYAYAFNVKNGHTYNRGNNIFSQIGMGYTAGQKRFTTTLFYIRPGVKYQLTSQLSNETAFICDFGIQFFVKRFRVKRWKKPWFIRRKKPNTEYEFSGQKAGNESSKNLSDNKRYKLNKKKRKYKTGKKKIKNKKNKKKK